MKQDAKYKVWLETPSGEVIATDDADVAVACIFDWDSYRAENPRMVLSVCLPDDAAGGQTRVSWWHMR